MYTSYFKMFTLPKIIISITLYTIIIAIISVIFKKDIKQSLKSLLSVILANMLPLIIISMMNIFSSSFAKQLVSSRNTLIVIILLLILLLCGLGLYVINHKIYKQKLIAIVISIVFMPYLILVPIGTKESIEDYRNTYIGDNSKVSTIISLLNIEKESISLKTTIEPYELIINMKNENIVNSYKEFEKNAAIMFNLITNVSIINYNYMNKNYIFNYDDVNNIFNGNLRNISVDNIMNYYMAFNNEYVYMGYISGYKIFDESSFCEENEELIMKEGNKKYYITCSTLDDIYLYSDNERLKLKDKLNEFTIKELLKTNLNIYEK